MSVRVKERADVTTDVYANVSQPRSGMTELASEPTAGEIPVIELVAPMPGFPASTHFALVQLDDRGILCALRSLEEPDVRFLVLPAAFFDGYSVEVDDDTVEALGITRAEDVLALVVVNAGESAVAATANLLAPILVNTASQKAAQVILHEDLPVRAPLQLAS